MAKRKTFQLGDQVVHSLTGQQAEVRQVFRSQIYIFFWVGERTAVRLWVPKTGWNVSSNQQAAA